MGFFSSLLSIKTETLLPHRMVGRMAKDRCIGLSVSDKEICLLKKLQLDKEQFIYARNELLVKIFNLFFQVYIDKTADNPNATVKVAGAFFQEGVMEYWASVPETEKTKMRNLGVAISYGAELETSAERLYLTVSGRTFDSLSPDQQAELKEVVNSYVKDVADFFKNNLPKLLG